ncbi:hypothetical protein ES703_113823 [subsurface metagenome]
MDTAICDRITLVELVAQVCRGIIPYDAVADRTIAVIQPAAKFTGRVANDGAVDDGAVAVIQPAAVSGRVAAERAIGQRRAAGVVVRSAAELCSVPAERAVS